MVNFAGRNCLIYFKNRQGVFASLVGALIVVALYIVFLSGNLTKNYPSSLELDYLMNSWAMAGLVSVAAMTTTLASLSNMIRDRENGRRKDFLCSPIKTKTLVGGYIASSFLVGTIMSLVTFAVSEIYIVCSGGQILAPVAFAKAFCVILLTVMASSALMLFIVSLFKSMDTFSTTGSIISALAGFLTGIYIPIGDFPSAVQNVIQIFPISHGTVLLRQIMMEKPMQGVFSGASVDMVWEFKQRMGVEYVFANTTEGLWVHIGYLIGSAVLFFVLATLVMSKKQKEL